MSLLVIFVCVCGKRSRKQKAILKVQITYIPFVLKIEQ